MNILRTNHLKSLTAVTNYSYPLAPYNIIYPLCHANRLLYKQLSIPLFMDRRLLLYIWQNNIYSLENLNLNSM